ncbi:hypothetical protein Tco_0324020, partial [Tanacetum coccineum]
VKMKMTGGFDVVYVAVSFAISRPLISPRMGPSVRRLYVQGKEINGAGMNASLSVTSVLLML